MRLIYLIAVLTKVLSATATHPPDVYLRQELDEIRAVVGVYYDPCKDFHNFACGHFCNVSKGNGLHRSDYLSEFSDEVKKFAALQSQMTQMSKDFLESCYQHKNPQNILLMSDIFKSPSEFDVAIAWGILKRSNIDIILKTTIQELERFKFRITISPDEDLFLSKVSIEKEIAGKLEMLGVNPQELIAEQKRIVTFIKKGQSILFNAQETSQDSPDVRDVKNFNWNAYLSELKKLSKLSSQNCSTEVVLKNVLSLKKIIDLVSQTDLQTLRLITALHLMDKIGEPDCGTIAGSFKVPNLAVKYFYPDVLREFEKVQNSINPKLKSSINVLDSLNFILDDYRLTHFKDIKIDRKNFFRNILTVKRIEIFESYPDESRKKSALNQELQNLFKPSSGGKVFFHSQRLFLWELFFRVNSPNLSSANLRNCLIAQRHKYKLNAPKNLDYSDYVERFVSIKQSYLDFKEFWNKNYGSRHSFNNIFKELKITSDQAYFVNLVQRECAQGTNGTYMTLLALMNIEDAGKAFNCPADSKFNMSGKCIAW